MVFPRQVEPNRRSVVLRAHGKINLALEVVRRRPDGYHDLSTVFAAVSLYDTIRIEIRTSPSAQRKRVTVHCEGWQVGRGMENLCARAAHVFLRESGPPAAQIHISIIKRLPPGGGLGGGSADAAAVLIGLGALLGQPPTPLPAMAGELGSDVPFFVQDAPLAYACGRGDVLEGLPRARWATPVVLAWPGAPVQTAWAYSLLDESTLSGGQTAAEIASQIRQGKDISEHVALGHNAFTRKVCTARPDVAALFALLKELGSRTVSLAGSGACVWAIFGSATQAERAVHELRARGFWAAYCLPAPRPVEIVAI